MLYLMVILQVLAANNVIVPWRPAGGAGVPSDMVGGFSTRAVRPEYSSFRRKRLWIFLHGAATLPCCPCL